MGFMMNGEAADSGFVSSSKAIAGVISLLSLGECLLSWLGSKSSFLYFFLVCNNKTKMEKGERNYEEAEYQNKIHNKYGTKMGISLV